MIHKLNNKFAYVDIISSGFVVGDYKENVERMIIYYMNEDGMKPCELSNWICGDGNSKLRNEFFYLMEGLHINDILPYARDMIFVYNNYVLYITSVSSDRDGYSMSFIPYKMSVEEFVETILNRRCSYKDIIKC